MAVGYELNNPMALWNKFSEGIEPVVIAYKALGRFKTAFPEGIKEEGSKKVDAKSEPVEIIKQSVSDSAIIVFADVDFLNDQFAFKESF